MNHDKTDHLDDGVHQLLLRASAPAPDETMITAGLVRRAESGGRARLRRRRAAWTATGVTAAALAVVIAVNLAGPDDTRRLVVASPAPTVSSSVPYIVVPTAPPGRDELADLPGDPTFDWRTQVRESLLKYPGVFFVPDQLPPDVLHVTADASNGGHPVIDVGIGGPHVVICALELRVCQDEITRGWELVRTADVDDRPVHVLIGTLARLTTEQRQYWETVRLTDAAPAWLTDRSAPSLPVAPSTPAQNVRITYADGTAVTWRGPARGPGWIAGTELAEVYSGQLNVWDRQVRDSVFGGGWSEEVGVHLDADGAISYARSAGVFASFVWAQGSQLPFLDLDPCSQWPASVDLRQPEGSSCRVITVDGHPVVLAERAGEITVFSVRADGVAVQVNQRAFDEEPIRSGVDLARAALTLPAP